MSNPGEVVEPVRLTNRVPAFVSEAPLAFALVRELAAGFLGEMCDVPESSIAERVLTEVGGERFGPIATPGRGCSSSTDLFSEAIGWRCWADRQRLHR